MGREEAYKFTNKNSIIDGVIDITTTEVADFFMGGVMACTEDRFGSCSMNELTPIAGAIARTKIPCVVSCGALDMVNFGEMQTVPEKYKDRLFHIHNSQVHLFKFKLTNLQQGHTNEDHS